MPTTNNNLKEFGEYLRAIRVKPSDKQAPRRRNVGIRPKARGGKSEPIYNGGTLKEVVVKPRNLGEEFLNSNTGRLYQNDKPLENVYPEFAILTALRGGLPQVSSAAKAYNYAKNSRFWFPKEITREAAKRKAKRDIGWGLFNIVNPLFRNGGIVRPKAEDGTLLADNPKRLNPHADNVFLDMYKPLDEVVVKGKWKPKQFYNPADATYVVNKHQEPLNITTDKDKFYQALIERIKHNDKVLYLHYPDYLGSVFGGTKSQISSKINGFLNDPQINVGHNAVITLDNNGRSKYYEYGRYAPGDNTIGYAEKHFGNVVNVAIPDKRKNESDSSYIARIQSKLPHSNAGRLFVNAIDGIDKTAVDNYFINLSHNQDRKPYTVWSLDPVTCATVANDAIKTGLTNNDKQILNTSLTDKTNKDIVRTIFNPINGLLQRKSREGSFYNMINPYSSGNYFNYFKPISETYKFNSLK